ncbi:MAG: hypothetical protein J6T63_08340 [Bacteroidales bacterium]|jgi:hypothetical protein|nr:hypothetical protein [Bacteroidales bacterium]
MKKVLILVTFVFAFAFLRAQTLPSWLLGTWEIPSVSAYAGSSFEVWKRISDSNWEGKTYRMFGNDTIIFDRMSMLADGGKVVIKMTAEKEGKRFDASFVGTKLCEELWAFECPDADSPSAIYYRNLGNGQVYVWTEVKTNFDVCADFIMYKQK